MQNNHQQLSTIPPLAGVGLRAEHYQEIIKLKPDIAWFEVHSENYFSKGGKPHYYLEIIRQNYPLSFHGIGLSLGSSDELNLHHLKQLKILIERYEPYFVSEHLCWSSINNKYFNDLLPLPYNEESLNHITDRINKVQDYLNRKILIENITSYLQFTHSSMVEYEFINLIAQKTGCGIVLDINNLFINSINHQWDVKDYIKNINSKYIQEIHLAGFTENLLDNGSILIDTHDKPVAYDVWEVYLFALHIIGNKPTLIEWDKNLPPLDILLNEANKANYILKNRHVPTM